MKLLRLYSSEALAEIECPKLAARVSSVRRGSGPQASSTEYQHQINFTFESGVANSGQVLVSEGKLAKLQGKFVYEELPPAH